MADYRQDNRRLGFAIICATLLHVILGVGALFVDWSPSVPPQEFGPLYVEFESLPEIARPEPIPRPEPARLEPVPPPSQPIPQPTVQPTPPPQAATPPPPAAAPQPQPAPAPQPAAPPQPADPEPGPDTSMQDYGDLGFLHGGSPSGTPRERPPSAAQSVDPTATASPEELPAWQVLADSGISTAAMDQAQVVHVARRVDADSRFRDQLQAAIQAVQTAPTTRPPAAGTSGADGSGPAVPMAPSGTETGDGVIRWTDAAGRGGVPSKPRITAEMFGGTVPGRVEFVVLFDVNSRGQVVPGSLVFQTPSGYTRVNEEVRRTISGWTFQPKPGTPVESAIFTLIVFREDVL